MKAKPVTIAVANLKGGVGKTTTAVNLAGGLARQRRRTLLVDMDAQRSATVHLTGSADGGGGGGLFDVLEGKRELGAALSPTTVENLLLLSPEGERERAARFAREGEELALRRSIAGAGGGGLDFVVIDTPPSVDRFTSSALAASDRVLVPVTCEYLPLVGLRQFNELLGEMKRALRLGTQVLGYLLTMVDRREKITWEVEEIMRRTFGSLLFDAQIRVDTKLKACASFRTTIFEFEPEEGRARADYAALTREVLERIGAGG